MIKKGDSVASKLANDFGKDHAQKVDMVRNKGAYLWAECSRIQKECKKVKKTEKKVLTFSWKFDKIHKLTRAGHRRVSTEP